ncbi:D-alanyl-D-alanine carboxypeptidase/D-alanyl-D-alanine endopeptidase [Phytohabitans rumicis]|nr:D-alanyl-D-alanine carboxypeptidase/D-alanyl-D-alanine-endopeptidase [Phytohabitans rumicis]
MVVLLGGFGAGAVIVRPGPVADWLGEPGADPTSAAAPQTPEPSPAPVLAAATGDAPAPTAAGVQAVLDPIVASAGLGSQTNLSVVDVTSAGQLYSRGPDVPTVPASTTKLVTATAVLAARGPAYRIPTRVVAGANPGEVVIIGGGDPTLAINGTGTYPGAARLDQLAKQVKQALGEAKPTKVIVDSSLFTGPVYEPSWDADVPTGGFGGPTIALMTNGARINPKATRGYAERYTQPDVAAGRAFAKLLGLPQSAVTKGKAPADAVEATTTPSSAPLTAGTELGKVESPPILRLVEFMLGESDNVVAELLARQVALAKGQPASYAGAAAATNAVLGELGLPAAESALSDGSGLSRKNRLTPTLLTDLLALAAGGSHPELAGVVAGLPVAAWSGTLRDRFRSPAVDNRPGAGVVRAKTGTLNGVNAIAGVVVTADGRLLAFAVLADKVPLGKEKAETALDKIPTALAKCGCL